MPPNNGILFNGVFCYFLNLDFLLPHIAYFDYSNVLLFLVFKTFEFTFSVFFFSLQRIWQHVLK